MLTAACRSYYWSVASFCGSVLPPSFCLSVKNHTIHLQSVYECLAHRASVSRTVSGVDILESWRDEGGFSCVRWDLEHTWHRRTNRVFNWKAAFFRNNQECNARLKHECGEIQITKPTKKHQNQSTEYQSLIFLPLLHLWASLSSKKKLFKSINEPQSRSFITRNTHEPPETLTTATNVYERRSNKSQNFLLFESHLLKTRNQ